MITISVKQCHPSSIKSKERVSKFGEVFTPAHIVSDMCDLIPYEIWQNIDATFLEPSCGNGNFIVEILKRKLSICHNSDEIIRAYKSIYGIDIQQDNVEETKTRMLKMLPEDTDINTTIQIIAILQSQIICGDSLQIMKQWEESNNA